MPRLQFLHDSLQDYFCAEGLCEEGVTELADLADDYALWGQVMHLLPDLLDASALHDFLSHDAILDWQHNDFALDCLPRLYRRRGHVDDVDHLLSLVGDVHFQTRKREKQHLCYYPLLEDVQCALEEAIKRFCGKPGGSINYSYLPEVVRFSLLRPLVRTSKGGAGSSVVELASEGNYIQAMRLAQLVGADAPEAAYHLLLLIVWIAARKAGDVRLGQGRTAEDMAHYQSAQKALDEALRIDARWCRLPHNEWENRDAMWEMFLLDLARTLLDKGLEAQAIAVIKRFGDPEQPESILEDAAVSPRWNPPPSKRRAAAASHYLMTASESLDGAARTRLVERAEELARALPPKGTAGENRAPARWVELVRVAVAYASAGAHNKAGQLYSELLGQWITGWQEATLEQPPDEDQKVPASVVRQVDMLDVLLTGLRKMDSSPWMRDWCAQLDATVGLSAPWCPVASPLRVAEGCALGGDPDRAEALLTSVIGDLDNEDKTAPDTLGEAIERTTQIAQKLSPPWQTIHLWPLMGAATRCLADVARRIVPLLEELERPANRDDDNGIDEVLYFELPPLFKELRQCAQSACTLLQIVRRLSVQDLARCEITQAIQAIDQLVTSFFSPRRFQTMLLLEMAVELWDMDEIDLAEQALAPGKADISTAFSEYNWESDREAWTDIFRAWRGRCPALWTTYRNIRDTRDAALSTERQPPLTMEWCLKNFPLSEIAEYFEREAHKARQKVLRHAAERYTGHFLLDLLDALASRGAPQEQEAAEIYRWLLNGFFGLKVPETTLVEALCKAAFDADFQTEMVRRAEANLKYCYLLAVMARALLQSGRRNEATDLFERVLDSMKRERFWDEELAWALINFADGAQEQHEQTLARRALEEAQSFSERVLERARSLRSRSRIRFFDKIIAEHLGVFDPSRLRVLAAVAGRLSRQGWPEEGRILFDRVFQVLPHYNDAELRAEVATELWHSGERAKAREILEPTLRAIQDRLAQVPEDSQDPEDPLGGPLILGLNEVRDVDVVAEALREMEEPERRRNLLERASEYFARVGIFHIPDPVLTLAKLGRLAEAQQLAEEKLSQDDAKLAVTYLELAGMLPSGDDSIAKRMLSTIRDRRGPQWILVKARLGKFLGNEERPRQLAALLRLPESGEWDVTESLLAGLITMCDMRGNPVVSTPLLLDIYQVCQALASLSVDTSDSPE